MAGVVALAAVASITAHAADPDALWKIVHGRCVPNFAATGNPVPCAEVTADWAVLKDINGATQFLLIPTAKTSGIEDPAILAPGAPSYFAAAWSARHFVEERAGYPLPRDAVALAINAQEARSQQQLHIHVDCIRPEVLTALHGMPVGDHWTKLPQPIEGQTYQAMYVPGDTLTVNPFDLLANTLPGAKQAMGQYTLAAIGDAAGFTLLAGQIGAGRWWTRRRPAGPCLPDRSRRSLGS